MSTLILQESVILSCDDWTLSTVDIEHSHVRFLGNLVLNLWDCGGQEAFMEQYFASQRDSIFKHVEVCVTRLEMVSKWMAMASSCALTLFWCLVIL